MFNKILVAHDFTPLAIAASQLGLWLAKTTNGSLTLAHVIADFKKAFINLSVEARNELAHGDIEKFEISIKHDADSKLTEFEKNLKPEGVAIKREILLGAPYVALTHLTQKEKYDLVISGTRELGVIKRALVGSNAKNLVRNCPSAVWVVKDQDVRTTSSIVVAVDFSEISSRALEIAAWLSKQSGATLHIIHVIDNRDYPSGMFTQLFSISGVSRDWMKEIEQSAQRNLKDLLAKYQVENCTQNVIWGEPHSEINNAVEKLQADLIVMGTVGRSGLAGILLGNTAEKVLDNCKVDLLSIKPDSFNSSI